MSITLSSEQYAQILAALGAAIRSNTEDQLALLRSQNALYTSALEILTGAIAGRGAAAAAPAHVRVADAVPEELNNAFIDHAGPLSPPHSPAAPVPLTPPPPPSPISAGRAARAELPAAAAAAAPAAPIGRNNHPLMNATAANNPLRLYDRISIDFRHAGLAQTYHARPRFVGARVTFVLEGRAFVHKSLNSLYGAAEHEFRTLVEDSGREAIPEKSANGWTRWYVTTPTGVKFNLKKLEATMAG